MADKAVTRTAMLRRVKEKVGQNGPFLVLTVEIDGEGLFCNLFDQWYWEEGSAHDIQDYANKPVIVTYEEVQKGDKTFRNVLHIEPDPTIIEDAEAWVKPADGMGDRKPSKRADADRQALAQFLQACADVFGALALAANTARKDILGGE